MPELRVLDRIARQTQRLGFLKRLIRRVTTTSTSNLENLGYDLVDTVARKVQVPLTEDRVIYIKQRLFDRTYTTLKKQADDWLKKGQDTEPSLVPMELQDLYLADPKMPSGVGKLVREDWRRYPPFGVSLGLIRSGTYSTTTRSVSLVYLTPESEQKAFLEYLPDANPFILNDKQKLLFFYSLLDNDGEVVVPLWSQLLQNSSSTFNDREAGNLLPEIYQALIARHRKRMLSADIRERLFVLEGSMEKIIIARQSEKYTGGSAREESSRVRVEPYVDIDIFTKPDRFKYEYQFSNSGTIWAKKLSTLETTQDIGEFLSSSFFTTASEAWGIEAKHISDPEKVVPHLYRVSEVIASPGGYAPIEEMSLLAGIEGLLEHGVIIEQAVAREAIISYQKANPYKVRFTVDRMGVLAHARFLEPSE